MSTVHKNLTGADLHEPKGADTALSGQVYVSNGSGSGVWTTASSIITNTAFTTGDWKFTHKNTPDTGWIFWFAGTIGDGSSSATLRANSDTSALFALFWSNYSNTVCPVSGGRGASAAADFAAHKTLTLPPGPGLVLGLTTATNNASNTAGAATATLTQANLPNVTLGLTGTISVTSSATNVLTGTLVSPIISTNVPSGQYTLITSGTGAQSTISSTGNFNTGSTASINGNQTQTSISLLQPTVYYNAMVKL